MSPGVVRVHAGDLVLGDVIVTEVGDVTIKQIDPDATGVLIVVSDGLERTRHRYNRADSLYRREPPTPAQTTQKPANAAVVGGRLPSGVVNMVTAQELVLGDVIVDATGGTGDLLVAAIDADATGVVVALSDGQNRTLRRYDTSDCVYRRKS